MFQGLKKIHNKVTLKMSQSTRGYGISLLDIQEIYNSTSNPLIITVDNGIRSFEAVKICKELNIEIIITDHHIPLAEANKEVLPDCIIVNPLQNKCKYPNKSLSGACVALKVIQALLPNDFTEYLYLAAISIISDVMSVLGENRLILKNGLEQMHKKQLPFHIISFFNEANQELKNKKNKDKDFFNIETINEDDIGFYIAPMINSAGRLYSPEIACDVLMGKKSSKILVEINFERQEKTKTIMENIKSKIQINGQLAFVCDKIEEGLVGIVAGKIKEEYPDITFSVVLSSVNGKTAKGSIRSDYIDAEKITNYCSDIVNKFGGHKRAGGVSLDLKNVDKFYFKLSSVIKEMSIERKTYIDLPLKDASLIDLEVVSWINSLAPFGTDNPKPLVMTKITPKKCSYLGDGSHMKFLLNSSAQAIFLAVKKDMIKLENLKDLKQSDI